MQSKGLSFEGILTREWSLQMIVEIDPVVTRGCFGEWESMHEVVWSWTRVGGMKKCKKKVKKESEVAQSCSTLCDPMDCSPLGSSIHWILQARILEWVAISFSRGSSRPRSPTLQADASTSEPPTAAETM